MLPGRKKVDVDAGGFVGLAVRRQESPQPMASLLCCTEGEDVRWEPGCPRVVN